MTTRASAATPIIERENEAWLAATGKTKGQWFIEQFFERLRDKSRFQFTLDPIGEAGGYALSIVRAMEDGLHALFPPPRSTGPNWEPRACCNSDEHCQSETCPTESK